MNIKIPISFEFYPPQSDEGFKSLQNAQAKLCELNPLPDFFSVTYGAGGTTQAGTMRVVAGTLHKFPQVPIIPHLTCIGAKKTEVGKLLEKYIQMGVNRLVVLRGDLPSGTLGALGEFKHAIDLVKFVRSEFSDNFYITVAAYPEMHPHAKNLREDVNYFAEKVEAGADCAITQFFFNPEAYANFINLCKDKGVKIPILPGIMPINKLAQLQRFSSNCGSDIPRWLSVASEGLSELEQIQLGINVVSQLCQKLIAMGAPALHFYTLNRVNLVLDIIKKISN